MTENAARQVINARGLRCPMPVLRLARQIREGAREITLLTDDPAALVDVPSYCAEQGWEIAAQEDKADNIRLWHIRLPAV